LWDATVNASEEQNELAWRYIADSSKFLTGKIVHTFVLLITVGKTELVQQ